VEEALAGDEPVGDIGRYPASKGSCNGQGGEVCLCLCCPFSDAIAASHPTHAVISRHAPKLRQALQHPTRDEGVACVVVWRRKKTSELID